MILAMVFQIVVVVFACGLQAKEFVFKGKTYDIAAPGETEPGEIIIKMKPGMSALHAEKVAARLGARITGTIEEYGLYRIELNLQARAAGAGDAVLHAIGAAKSHPNVAAAFSNFKFSIPKPVGAPGRQGVEGSGADSPAVEPIPALAPSGNQWHLKVIDAALAGAPPVTTPIVAVIDTGVEYNHPDLNGRVLLGKDFVDDDWDPFDENGHGTHCAGLIAATGSYMVRGVSPTSKVLAVRVLNASGSGSFFNIMAGIVYARAYPGVKILSISLGGYLIEGSAQYNTLKKVVDDTVALGVLPVIAAGNENDYNLYFYQGATGKYRPVPAWFPSSFTVGATQESDMRAYFSNYDVATLDGKTFNYNFVDIVAPGWNILSTYSGGQVARLNGTSMATPIVAGCAAFYWGAHPATTAASVASVLKNYGMPVGPLNGFPSYEYRVDLMRAMGKYSTGFVGVVYNGQTSSPLTGAFLQIMQGTTVKATTTTDMEGFFSVSGLIGGQTYSLVFSKAGFGPSYLGGVAVAGKMTNLAKPVFLNQTRPAGQWSVVIDWRSWHPGYEEAYRTYPAKPIWYPYNWNTVAGTFMAPYVSSTSLGTIEMGVPGSLTESPFMVLTTNAFAKTHPVNTFVIKPQAGQTYKVYTVLDNINGDYYNWGGYKNVTNGTMPLIQARIYLAGTSKASMSPTSATGTGAYWYIGDIAGTTFTPKNQLQALAP